MSLYHFWVHKQHHILHHVFQHLSIEKKTCDVTANRCIFTLAPTGLNLTVDFGEVKTAPTECKEKCFQIMSFAYLHYSKAP